MRAGVDIDPDAVSLEDSRTPCVIQRNNTHEKAKISHEALLQWTACHR